MNTTTGAQRSQTNRTAAHEVVAYHQSQDSESTNKRLRNTVNFRELPTEQTTAVPNHGDNSSYPLQTSARMSVAEDRTAGSSVNASGLSRAERVRAQSAKGDRGNRA